MGFLIPILFAATILIPSIHSLHAGTCLDLVCGHHGHCHRGPTNGTYWCRCDEGYGGLFCELKCDLNCDTSHQKCVFNENQKPLCVCKGEHCHKNMWYLHNAIHHFLLHHKVGNRFFFLRAEKRKKRGAVVVTFPVFPREPKTPPSLIFRPFGHPMLHPPNEIPRVVSAAPPLADCDTNGNILLPSKLDCSIGYGGK
ncbi:hypothetical protein CAEBREN_28111 [Caenorhabditis brenneri]|uniref:EGF-like domain-containing protein n=1 Tax=Caenorhabditis brenneri TaxID=135651 RepID=G0NB09_CAEBE|nr:hypothetical protein CAEBREN_28111 [Caenorhabditis brenneri]